MSAEPNRHPAGFGPRVQSGIVDRVVFSFEINVVIGPQRLHDLNLFLRPFAAIFEVLIQAGEFQLIPTHANAKPQAAIG